MEPVLSLPATGDPVPLWLEPEGKAADQEAGVAVGAGNRNQSAGALGEAARRGTNLRNLRRCYGNRRERTSA